MGRLSGNEINGIWDGITMTWDEKYRFDEKTYAQNIERMISAGVHGLYTNGSTGEFYTLDFQEYCCQVDLISQLCGDVGMPLQIGCCSDATSKTIKLLEYAAGKKDVGAVQVNIPYWMELTDRELIQFFKDLHTSCPEMPIVHYNVSRSKRFLTGTDYLRILEVAPNLVGVKYTFAGNNFSDLQEAIRLTPKLSYFVAEPLLASAMQLGARGSCSSLIATNPKFMLDFYSKAKSGNWTEAFQMQRRVSQFFTELDDLCDSLGEGGIDPVADKGLGVASGCVLGSQRCRAPYIGWSDDTVDIVNKWLKKDYPEFVYSPK